MRKTITSINIDLKFLLDTPPPMHVVYTNHDEAGRETHGTATLMEDLSKSLVTAEWLEQIKAAIEVKESGVNEPGAIAERVAAADEAERRARVAEYAKEAAELAAQAAELNMITKRAEAEQAIEIRLQQADAALEAKRAEFAAIEKAISDSRPVDEAAPER